MRVKDINGTSGNKCGCGSWLDHWKKFSRLALPTYCAEQRCLKRPEVGAHVQKDSTMDRAWYIIPVCSTHNAKAVEMDINDSAVLVSANVSQTCGLPVVLWR